MRFQRNFRKNLMRQVEKLPLRFVFEGLKQSLRFFTRRLTAPLETKISSNYALTVSPSRRILCTSLARLTKKLTPL